MTLSKRLAAMAAMVPRGTRAADIGTDHGFVPIWLIENGVCSRVCACDVREKPLKTAVINARDHGVDDRIDFHLADGLAACRAEDTDVILIAGMGGETIAGILERAPWSREKLLILQPQSKLRTLRAWLDENGLTVEDAELVSDTGRIYVIWRVRAGQRRALRPEEYYVDPSLRDKDSALLGSYLSQLIKKENTRLCGLRRSAAPDAEELDFHEKALEGFLKMRRELQNAEGI